MPTNRPPDSAQRLPTTPIYTGTSEPSDTSSAYINNLPRDGFTELLQGSTVFPWLLNPSRKELGTDFLHQTAERKPGEIEITPDIRVCLDEIEAGFYEYEQALIKSSGRVTEDIVVKRQSVTSYLEQIRGDLSSRDFADIKMIVDVMVMRLEVVHMMLLAGKPKEELPKPVYAPALANMTRRRQY